MIFYEVEHGDGHYLVATQADAKREARERKCTWSQTDVPTDKAGLMNYINLLLRTASREDPLGNGEEYGLVIIDEAGPVTEAQFEAATKSHMSQAQVDKMFEPTERTSKLTPDDVDQVCILIEGMRGAAIGHVAHSLAARIERLGKELQA